MYAFDVDGPIFCPLTASCNKETSVEDISHRRSDVDIIRPSYVAYFSLNRPQWTTLRSYARARVQREGFCLYLCSHITVRAAPPAPRCHVVILRRGCLPHWQPSWIRERKLTACPSRAILISYGQDGSRFYIAPTSIGLSRSLQSRSNREIGQG